MKPFVSALLTGLLISSLSGCATLFDKDNTPAPTPLTALPANATPVTVLWHTSTGGSNTPYLRLTPVIRGNRIFTASTSGQVTAIDRQSGKILWQTQTGISISAGTAANRQLVLAGGRKGELVALDQTTGKSLWQATASSEILAPPAATDSRVIVKSIDGHISAFSASHGTRLWSTFSKQPELILHSSSSPRVARNSIYAGFEDGTLARYHLSNGELSWRQTIASPDGIFPITRMVDLDSDPVVAGNHVFAATWQGRIARLSASNGDIDWSRSVSTYTPLAYDGNAVYVSDAKGHVHALGTAKGKTLWQQKFLEARTLTGPALYGRTLVIGDAEGWVHFLDKRTGKLITRYQAGGGGVFATPVVDGQTVYLLTKNGQLIACRMGQ